MVFQLTVPPPVPPRHTIPTAANATAAAAKRLPPPPHRLDHLDALLSMNGHREHATQRDPVVAERVNVRPWGDGSALADVPTREARPCGSDSQAVLLNDDDATTVLSSTLVIRRKKRTGTPMSSASSMAKTPAEWRRDATLQREAAALRDTTLPFFSRHLRPRESTELFISHALRLPPPPQPAHRPPTSPKPAASPSSPQPIVEARSQLSRPPSRRSSSLDRPPPVPKDVKSGKRPQLQPQRQQPKEPAAEPDSQLPELSPQEIVDNARRLRLMMLGVRERREATQEQLEELLRRRDELLAALDDESRRAVVEDLERAAAAEGLDKPALTVTQVRLLESRPVALVAAREADDGTASSLEKWIDDVSTTHPKPRSKAKA